MITKKVLLVIASHGYQPVEYAVPKNLLEQAGLTVDTASDTLGTATAKDNSTTTVDILVKDAHLDDYDGLFLIGGPGALDLLDNDTSYELITKFAKAKKPLGAICVSTRILAHAGILKNKQATGWDGDNELAGIYKEYGVHYVPKDVVVDGNIITATGPNAAREFAEYIITLLQENNGWQ